MDMSDVREFCREYNSQSIKILAAFLFFVLFLPLIIFLMLLQDTSEWVIYSFFAFWCLLYVWLGARCWNSLGMCWDFYQCSKSACAGNIKALSLLVHWSEYGLNGLAASYDTAHWLRLKIEILTKNDNSTSLIDFYRRNATQGVADAQFNLGRYYDYQGVDAEEAVNWYRKAAEQGHSNAKYELGRCYEQGVGILKSPVKAIIWYWAYRKIRRDLIIEYCNMYI